MMMHKPRVDPERRRRDLRRLAAIVVQHAGITTPPVRLETLIAQTTDLKVTSFDLNGEASGLIRWSGKRQHFHVLYDPAEHRWRFSLAHELGHYYIEQHCRAIRSRGVSHRSQAGFFSDRVMEQEADTFAAALLIPESMCDNDLEPCLTDVDAMKSRFESSWLCAALRLKDVTSVPTAVVCCENGVVRWSWMNDGFEDSGARIRWGSRVPVGSAVHEAAAAGGDAFGRLKSGLWMDGGDEVMLREECRGFRNFGYVIALLSPQDA